MNVGDPKKAIVLAVVAVGVVTAAVFRSIPSSGPAKQPAKATSTTPEESAKPDALPPEAALTVDSFSHPNLGAPRTAIAKPKVEEDTRPAQAFDRRGFKPMSPGDIDIIGPLLPGSPRESAGKSQQQIEERAPVVVRLESIVRADIAFVMLAIGNDKSAPLPKGAIVSGDIRIVRIKESSVVVSTRGKETEIMLGQEVQL
jgi:hypothetical protein